MDNLQDIARKGLEYIRNQDGVMGGEVFVSSISHLLTRINYTSSIPCNGVEEPKSVTSSGIGIQVVFGDKEGRRIGFGSVDGNLSMAGIKEAFNKAKNGAVIDPDFHNLPMPGERPALRPDYYDKGLLNLEDEILVEFGWRALDGAFKVLEENKIYRDIIIGGDVNVFQERMAIVNTEGIEAMDEAAYATASITVMLESENSKGSGWEIGMSLDRFQPEQAGEMAVFSAIKSRGGRRITSGKYRLILGPQAVADLLSNIVLPSLTLSVVDASSSTFMGKYGKHIIDRRISIYDNGASLGLPLSRRYTCEGLPTGKTNLIRHGILVGYLSNNYYTNKILGDPSSKDKIGAEPERIKHAIRPRNGFRIKENMFRNYKSTPYISPTNAFIGAEETMEIEELLTSINKGLYIGRIWYTYPVNGLLAGDFTCTVIGDSFIIENGEIVAPLQPNTVRITDNIHRLFNQVAGITGDTSPVLLWGSPEVIYSPSIGVHDISLQAIG